MVPLRSDGVSPGEFPLTDARAESEAETFLLQLEGDQAIRPGTFSSVITLANDDSQPVLVVSVDESIDPSDRVLLLTAELSVSDRYLRSEDTANARVVLLRQDGLDSLALGDLSFAIDGRSSSSSTSRYFTLPSGLQAGEFSLGVDLAEAFVPRCPPLDSAESETILGSNAQT